MFLRVFEVISDLFFFSGAIFIIISDYVRMCPLQWTNYSSTAVISKPPERLSTLSLLWSLLTKVSVLRWLLLEDIEEMYVRPSRLLALNRSIFSFLKDSLWSSIDIVSSKVISFSKGKIGFFFRFLINNRRVSPLLTMPHSLIVRSSRRTSMVLSLRCMILHVFHRCIRLIFCCGKTDFVCMEGCEFPCRLNSWECSQYLISLTL